MQTLDRMMFGLTLLLVVLSIHEADAEYSVNGLSTPPAPKAEAMLSELECQRLTKAVADQWRGLYRETGVLVFDICEEGGVLVLTDPETGVTKSFKCMTAIGI